MGSRTFQDMAAYWPTSSQVFAPPMNQIPKAVFSRRGTVVLKASDTTAALRDARANAGPHPSANLQPGGDSWGHAYVASGDLAEEIAKLKAQDGKPIIAHGGASFARSLVALRTRGPVCPAGASGRAWNRTRAIFRSLYATDLQVGKFDDLPEGHSGTDLSTDVTAATRVLIIDDRCRFRESAM